MITEYTIENLITLFKKYGLDIVTLQATTLEDKPVYYAGLVDWVGKVLAGVAPGTGQITYEEKEQLLSYFIRYCEDVGQIKQIGKNLGELSKEGGSYSINDLLVDGLKPVVLLKNPPLADYPTSLHVDPNAKPLQKPIDHFGRTEYTKSSKFSEDLHGPEITPEPFTQLGDAAKKAAIAVDTMGGTLDRMSVYILSNKWVRVWGLFRWVALPVDLKVYGAVCKLVQEVDGPRTRYAYRVEENHPDHEVQVNLSGSDLLPYRAALELKRKLKLELSF